MAHDTVEINGRLYDAGTGLPLDVPTKLSHPVPIKKPIARPRRSIDGVSTPHAKNIPLARKPKAATPIVTPEKPKLSSSRQTNAVHSHPQHSLTLRRRGVTVPKHVVEAKTQSTPTISKKIDLGRFERAKKIEKSSLIKRFHAPSSAKFQTAPVLDIKKVPGTQKTAQTKKTETGTDRKERLIKESLAKVSITDASTKAENRKRLKITTRHKRIASFASSAFVTLVLAGYVAYLNVPAISMKIASKRAGFAATLPGYKPSGYSLRGPIAYSPGQVTINFGSNTDDRHFSLRQEPTSWDSEALKENFVAKNTTTEPQIYSDSGLTIYIFNGNNAAWVNNGKMYHINGGNSQLDTAQLLNLATSV